jgi:hypothetical protein
MDLEGRVGTRERERGRRMQWTTGEGGVLDLGAGDLMSLEVG